MKSINDHILDRILKHEVNLAFLQNALAIEMADEVDQNFDIEFKAAQLKCNIRWAIRQGLNWFEERLIEVYMITRKVMGGAFRDLSGGLLLEARFGMETVLFAPPSIAEAKEIVRRLKKEGSWAANTSLLVKNKSSRVQGQLAKGLAAGEIPSQIAKRMREKIGGAKSYKAFVRTEVQRVNNQALQDLYKANEEFISGQQYKATFDNRTCVVCGPDDGKIFWSKPAKGQKSLAEAPHTPRHINCRCLYTPVLKNIKTIAKDLGVSVDVFPPGAQKTINGQIASVKTYSDWLKDQPEATQFAILGRERFQLLQRGIPIQQFKTGDRALSIVELEKLIPGEVADVPEVMYRMVEKGPKKISVKKTRMPEWIKAGGGQALEFYKHLSPKEKQWANKLTEREWGAVYDWTAASSDLIRGYEGGWDVTKYGKEMSELFNSALNKSRVHRGELWRAFKVKDPKDWKKWTTKGSKINFGGASTSFSEVVGGAEKAVDFDETKRNIMFKVKNGAGVSIKGLSAYHEEQEVIVRQGANFKILSVKKHHFYTIVELEQIGESKIKFKSKPPVLKKEKIEAPKEVPMQEVLGDPIPLAVLDMKQNKKMWDLPVGKYFNLPNPKTGIWQKWKKDTNGIWKEVLKVPVKPSQNLGKPASKVILKDNKKKMEKASVGTVVTTSKGMKFKKDVDEVWKKVVEEPEVFAMKMDPNKYLPPGIQRQWKKFSLAERNWISSLSEQELSSIDKWSDQSYTKVRNYESGKSVAGKKLSESLNGALDKAPIFKGKVWRGMELKGKRKADYGKWTKVGSKISFGATSSFSKDREVAEGFTGEGDTSKESLVFRVKNARGIDISKIGVKGEQEVLIRKGVIFRVLKVKVEGDFTVIDLEMEGKAPRVKKVLKVRETPQKKEKKKKTKKLSSGLGKPASGTVLKINKKKMEGASIGAVITTPKGMKFKKDADEVWKKVIDKPKVYAMKVKPRLFSEEELGKLASTTVLKINKKHMTPDRSIGTVHTTPIGKTFVKINKVEWREVKKGLIGGKTPKSTPTNLTGKKGIQVTIPKDKVKKVKEVIRKSKAKVEVPPKWKDVYAGEESIEQVTKVFEERFGIRGLKPQGFLGGLQGKVKYFEKVNIVGKSMTDMSRKFPKRFAEMKKHNPVQLTISSRSSIKGIKGAVGLYTPSKGKSAPLISITSVSVPIEAPLKMGGFGVEDSTSSFFRHEMGHHTHVKMMSMKSKLKWGDIYDEMGKTNVAKQVSKYASSNKHEFFAESFCAYTSPKYKRGMLPQKVEKFLDGFLT